MVYAFVSFVLASDLGGMRVSCDIRSNQYDKASPAHTQEARKEEGRFLASLLVRSVIPTV